MKINNDALSEVVSTLLTLFIVLGVVTAILFWGIPYLEENETRGEFQTILGGFDVMYDTMRGLIIDGYGTKGYSNVVSTNEKATLNIDSQGKKLILMYTFDDSDTADFNVSGLDDENESFIITTETDALIYSPKGVKIYWLDPGQLTQQYAFETPSYRKIYQDHWCVQSFTPPVDNWHLDKVKIYVSARGEVTSDLNVSIYPEDGGSPDVNNSLAKVIVSADEISSSFEWIECNFEPNIRLPIGYTYYIGANTSGGGFGNGTYNYYKWYLSKNSPYNSSSCYASITTDDGLEWTSPTGYDFGYRLKFTNNTPANTPEFVTNLQSTIYSGVEKSINVNATDPEEDEVRYRIFWGDDYVSDWSDLKDNGAIYGFKHTYAKPGTYTLTLQAKDDNGSIYEPDNITEIHVSTGDYLPEDSYYEEKPTYVQSESGPPYIWTITTHNNRSLNGTLRIDLLGSYYNPLGSRIPFARIWVFDLGSISFESPHGIGTQRTIFENGGILTVGPINSNVMTSPSFFEEDESIGFRIIQIGESYVTGASGSGTIELGLNMKNSYSREPRATEATDYSQVYNFKMQIYEPLKELEELWIDYFTTSYDFEKMPDMPNTIYYKGSKHFILDSSFIEVNVEGIR